MVSMSGRVYISGPISGTDDYMARFADAERRVREAGGIPVNPAAVNARLPKGSPYEMYMDLSMAMLEWCRTIFMLRGWENSRGARREKWRADEREIRVVYDDGAAADPDPLKPYVYYSGCPRMRLTIER